MESEHLIQTVNRTAALKMSSLHSAYERRSSDARLAHSMVDFVVAPLRRFVEPSPSQPNTFLLIEAG